MSKHNQDIQRKLLAWYDKTKRDLPWRNTKDPYSIWVSEIMLQQTQVKTVIPYYERWIKTLPTIDKLANEPEQKILKLEDFADLASDELTGGYDVVKGERIKIQGYLEDFALSKVEADELIMSARNIVYKD